MDARRRRFITFNVCGINNLKKAEPWKSLGSLGSMFDFLEADVICFQETKLQSKDLAKEHAIVPGFQSFFSFSREKKGYSGVVIYVRDNMPVIQAEEGLTGWLGCGAGTYKELSPSIGGYPDVPRSKGVEIDSEGRVVILDLGNAVVFGVYCPANASGTRTEYREEFFCLLDERIRSLIKMGRNIILLGDINVTRDLIDSAELLVRTRQAQTNDDTLEYWTNSIPRKIINGLVEDSETQLVDTTRELYKGKRGIYTQWNQMLNSRPSNFGSRLDYIFVSSSITCLDADIVPDLLGSDHCPVYADVLIRDAGAVACPPQLGLKSYLRFKTADLNAHFKSFEKTESPSSSQPTLSPPVAEATRVLSPRKGGSQHKITAFFGQSGGKVVKRTENPVQKAKIFESSPASVSLAEDHQEKWRSIFTRETPKCLHQQDCKLLVSKKPGRNKGRAFWVCQR